ncbi:MAG: hypothetical protein KQJ78_20555 [Deltaproteobacteria bacterium]|nr:hypothetical protein [Deltaproteobacteria bacterium]
MTEHPATTIRQAVAAAILAAGTDAGDRVYTGPVDPLDPGALPVVAVFCVGSEYEGEAYIDQPRAYRAALNLITVLWVQASATLYDELEELARQVRRAVQADESQGGAAMDTVWAGEDLSLEEDGGVSLGQMLINWRVGYIYHDTGA